MILEDIEIFNFRLLENIKLSFPKKICVLYGLNGQGKTSLLEAIYLLGHAKSFRLAKTKEFINWQSDEQSLLIKGRVRSLLSTKDISYSLVKGKQILLVNDKQVSSFGDYYGKLQVVSIAPDDEEIITGQPAMRRKFIDRLIASVFPEHINNLVSYQKTLKNKSALLKNSIGINDHVLKEQISVLNALLINSGQQIAKLRNEYTKKIEQHFQNYYRALLREKTVENSAIRYQGKFHHEDRLLSLEEIKILFEKNLSREIEAQNCLLGIQRDDLSFIIDSGCGYCNAKNFASKGQIKTIMLALKLACCEIIKEET